jgi:hypothetical protein
MNFLIKLLVSMFAILLIGAACNSLPNQTPTPVASQPAVTVSSPAANQTLAQGQEIQVQSTSIDPQQAIVRVELVVDGQVVWIDANADPKANTAFIVAQPWTPTVPGNHTIQVTAYNQNTSPAIRSAGGASGRPGQRQPAPPTTEVAPLASVETPAATAAPVELTPSPTATVTPTPTSTPAPQKFNPTGLEPDGRFKDIWLTLKAGASRLGYPTGPVIAERDFARQRFQKGLMIWWDNPENPDYIWVIDSPAKDNAYATSTCIPTPGKGICRIFLQAPMMTARARFGKVWCEHSELQGRLSKPTEGERGSGGNPPYAQVQLFQGGAMIYLPLTGEVFVLFAQGDWQRFDY